MRRLTIPALVIFTACGGSSPSTPSGGTPIPDASLAGHWSLGVGAAQICGTLPDVAVSRSFDVTITQNGRRIVLQVNGGTSRGSAGAGAFCGDCNGTVNGSTVTLQLSNLTDVLTTGSPVREDVRIDVSGSGQFVGNRVSILNADGTVTFDGDSPASCAATNHQVFLQKL